MVVRQRGQTGLCLFAKWLLFFRSVDAADPDLVWDLFKPRSVRVSWSLTPMTRPVSVSASARAEINRRDRNMNKRRCTIARLRGCLTHRTLGQACGQLQDKCRRAFIGKGKNAVARNIGSRSRSYPHHVWGRTRRYTMRKKSIQTRFGSGSIVKPLLQRPPLATV